ncbi:hypothetical protein [Tamlana sp. I1]|uniref:hypothetical protein n=1 Tax=Tamlana sp. I1 TaxID=2762061 RepID=UPI00188E9529|nr:hypothetical protein [Tamlana sp. I1]
MKKLLLVLCLVSLSVSCSKDDDPKYSASDLVGTWTLVSDVEGGCPREEVYTETTVSLILYYGTDCELNDESDVFSYSVEGNYIKVNNSSVEILELTAKTLKIKVFYENAGETHSEVRTYVKK